MKPRKSVLVDAVLFLLMMVFLGVTQFGCGANHVGEIIGVDPKPTTVQSATATVTPTS